MHVIGSPQVGLSHERATKIVEITTFQVLDAERLGLPGKDRTRREKQRDTKDPYSGNKYRR